MEIMTILLPLLIPVFSQLFAKCGDTASGQNDDPKAEVMALQLPDGSFKKKGIVASRRHSRHAIRLANRGKRRNDPSWIQPNNENADAATVGMFQHVLNESKSTVLASYRDGLSASFSPDDQ